jgi:hypothetical protein
MNNPSEKYFQVDVEFGPMDPKAFFVVRDELDRSEGEIGQIAIEAGLDSDEPGQLETPASGISHIKVKQITPDALGRTDVSDEIKIEMTGGIKLWRLRV